MKRPSIVSDCLEFGLLFLLSAVWALLLHHLVHQSESSGTGAPSRGVTLPFFATTNLLAVAALIATLGLFFVIPRIGFGFLQRGEEELIKVSGGLGIRARNLRLKNARIKKQKFAKVGLRDEPKP